jgi:hypothetical protein
MRVDLAVFRTPAPLKNILNTGSFMQRCTEGRSSYGVGNKLLCCFQSN